MAKTFTAIGIRGLSQGYHRDRGEGAARGLYVQVRPAEAGGFTRSWLYRFTSPITRKERWMGLGSTDVIGLAEARELARAAKRLVTLGADPIEKRRETIQAERDAVIRDRASRMTFRQCADAYLSSGHMDKLSSSEHRKQWRQSLDLASRAFGDVAVGHIDDAMVIKFLTPHWAKTLVTATRYRQRIEAVLDWATVHKFREGVNPARWDHHLEYVFPGKPEAEPHAAMPFAEVPGFLAKVREHKGVDAAVLEFTILTAARRGESINARWDEIDLTAQTWTIPAERMKAGREHTVPLSNRVVELLETLPRVGVFVFTAKTGKRVADTAMRKLLVKLAAGYSLHGFRSSFRDWAGEVSNFDREVIEHALAHKLPDRVEAAYRRGTALDKRRRLMAAWSSYCSGETTAKVVSCTPRGRRSGT
jgi:integrase